MSHPARRPFALALVLLALLAGAAASGCGSGGDGSTPPPGSDPLPPGSATTWVLVEVEPGEDVAEVVAEAGGTAIEPVPGTPYWRVALPAGTSPQAFARRLQGDARVVDVDLDVGLKHPEGGGSTLPAGGLLLAAEIPTQDELLRIGAVAARARATGQGVRVAVIDSGLVPHEFVDPSVDPGGWDYVDQDDDPRDEPDGVDDDRDGLVDEGWGHGLFVASLVLAVAPDARIVPFRVLDADGIGLASTVASAITLAADRGVQVVNLSVGMEARVAVVEKAIQSARERGVAVIASAGNTGLPDVSFPSSLSAAFAVTAVGADDVLAPFASYGSDVDLSAPGVELHGAWPSPTGTARWSGTSFSAALVTGAFALLREQWPAEKADDLLQRIGAAAASLEAANPDLAGRMGEGRLDLDATTAP